MEFWITKRKIGRQDLFLYEVFGDSGLVGKRTTARTYVACIVREHKREGFPTQYNVQNWFGRKDLIGKGESRHQVGKPGVYIAELKEHEKPKEI